ncbi:hypothetical protein HKX48_006177 [Thoreauomyces humboldtii]|nr:hypothetical protein HKX48_006177 [Thoreauomyces humboldtii]
MADTSGLRSDSPRLPSSTSSTDLLAHDSYDALAQGDLHNDPKYRRYLQAVDKILQSFDTVSEWADVIGFLTRLAKTLQAHPLHGPVPRKMILSKRLAQCLNPALPAGVHQKTVEIYALILEASGPVQLAEDLALWSHGLFPFLQNSTTTVKPLVLALYEKFYLPLGVRLKPSLKGLVLALLPVMEEENGECFQRGLSLLDKLAIAVGQGYFYHCLWLSLISSPHLRLAAVNYLLKRMPKISSAEDVAVVLGNQTGLLARALSAVLRDDTALVQRGGLELLVVHFPLKSNLFQGNDLTLVLQAAVSVVLRKDMSLNRRLYAWLLDSGDNNTLSNPTRESLAIALRSIFYVSSGDRTDLSKPYRILISLLDKTEIGQPILEDIFVDIIWSLREQISSSNTHNAELLQTATMFMDMVDPVLIWKQCYHIICNVNSPGTDPIESSRNQACQIMEFVISRFKWGDEETQRLHLPFLYKAIVTQLTAWPVDNPSSLPVLPVLLHLCNLIGRTIVPETRSHSWPLRDFIGANGIESVADSSMEELTSPIAASDPSRRLSRRESIFPEGDGSTHDHLLLIIDRFYAVADKPKALAKKFSGSPCMVGKPVLQAAFSDLLSVFPKISIQLSNMAALTVVSRGADVHAYQSFVEITDMISALATDFDPLSREHRIGPVSFIPDDTAAHELFVASTRPAMLLATAPWLRPLMNSCHEINHFPTINAALTCFISLLASPDHPIPHPAHFDTFIRDTISCLWKFLAPSHAAYHARTADLIWSLSAISTSYVVEEVICRHIRNDLDRRRIDNCDHFGIFWRLSVEAGHSVNMTFARPLFLLLDTLSSKDATVRRGGETWFRNFVKSYPRIVDPLLAILLNDKVVRIPSVVRVDQEDINVFRYSRGYNEEQVDYVFETLQAVLQFGERVFLKSIWTATVKTPAFLKAVGWIEREFHISNQRLLYAELFIILSLRFVESEPRTGMLHDVNDRIQIRAAEFLHLILTRSDHMNYHLLVAMQNIIVRKLLYCIHVERLDLQPTLLHILHAIAALMSPQRVLHDVGSPSKKSSVEATSSTPPSRHMSTSLDDVVPEDESSQQSRNSAEFPRMKSIGSSPAFGRAVLNSLTTIGNRPVLQHWMDFILSSLPLLRNSFRRVLLPIIKTICAQLTDYHTSITNHVQDATFAGPACVPKDFYRPAPADQDVMVLLYGLETIISFCLGDTHQSHGDASKHPHAPGGGLRFLTGYVASVFGSDEKGGEGSSGQQKMQETILNMLPRIFRTLQELSIIFRGNLKEQGNAIGNVTKFETGTSFEFVQDRVAFRIRKFLDATYKVHPGDTIESLVEVWFAENNGVVVDKAEHDLSTTSMDMIESVNGYAPRVIVNTLLESVRERSVSDASPQRGQSKRSVRKASTVSDASLLAFLEKYCMLRIDPTAVAETWSIVSAFAKDACAQTSTYRSLYLPLLRLLSVYLQRLVGHATPDEKRSHKEVEELYQKVCDFCTLIAGKAFEQGLWRKTTHAAEYTPELDAHGLLSPSGPQDGQVHPDVETVAGGSSRRSAKETDEALIQDIVAYFGATAVSTMRRCMHDQDRTLILLTNMVYYIVAPLLKSKQTIKSRLNPTLELLCAIAKVPGAQKAWRREAWDGFWDVRFFEMGLVASRNWRVIIHAVMSSDKEKVVELISRVSAAPSTTIFMSKDQETLIRAHAVRRLSFAIFSGPVDHYVPKLPSIQEKLVDIFKSSSGPMIIEAYLCLRVLLCRVSPHHLTNFWPTIITELIQVFDTNLRNSEVDKTSDTAAFLAACKFLDMVLVLQIETFQWHQWIFVTETLELNSDNRNPRPASYVEKLHLAWSAAPSDSVWGTSSGNLLADVPDAFASLPVSRPPSCDPITSEPTPKRRPILLMRSITSKRELDPFFKSVSREVYQGTYDLAQPDTQFLETILEAEFLSVDDAAVAASSAAPATTSGSGSLHLEVSGHEQVVPVRVASPQLQTMTVRRDQPRP